MSASGQPVFKPFPLFTGCHSQTLVAQFLTFSFNLSSTTRFVHLPDGERITCEINTPSNWKETDPTIIMVHGLCGSHHSGYLVRIARKLDKRHVRTIRINLRGCGTGRGHARRMMCHVDASNDVWCAVKEIHRDSPDTPLIIMGFSYGGNVVLKMAGEWGEEVEKLVSKVIAISPPIDMNASVQLLSKNRLYERYFMRYLRSDVLYLHCHFADLPPIKIPSNMSLLEFDEFYIAPQSGYLSVREYYYASSSGRLISEIRVRSHILFSKDDPIVDCNVMCDVKVPVNIDVLVTEQGGHLGYLGIPGQEGGFHWMDSIVLQWIFN